MSQMVSEYMRLESRLAGMAIGAEGADHDEVRLRLEIMMSQIELLQEGDLGKFINKSEQRKTVVATLIRNLHLLDKQVDTMTPEQVRQILPVLSELDGPLTSMAAATLTQDINIVNITHDKIQHLYYIYSVISILLIAMCITLGLLMLRQNNNLRRAHVRMKTLANDLQASKEKLQVQNRRLQYDAYHDSLTGMPNRLSFWQRLQEIVNQVRPYKGCAVVMLFDLDSFKDVNDTLGHDAGDKLLQALAHDEFKVYYQPIADTVTREIYGYEALVRWFHPVRGAVPPTVFIPVAEKIGLINALGEWVLKTACAEAASWATPLKVSVNVSPIQLMNTSLTDTIIEVLHQTGLDPRRLDLEITESDVFNENTRSLEILSQLREQGIQISIDDFGTGYSSLSRLSYFPFDKIKIDRSFVINIPEQKDDLDIVRLIISMGKSLHMRIVAEGVETEEQLASLQALGCDLVQGYLIGKPSPLR